MRTPGIASVASGKRLSSPSLQLQIGDGFPNVVGGELLAPGRHQRSWMPVVDSLKHLLLIEFGSSEIRRNTTALRLEAVAVVAAGIAETDALSYRLSISRKWVDRTPPDRMSRSGPRLRRRERRLSQSSAGQGEQFVSACRSTIVKRRKERHPVSLKNDFDSAVGKQIGNGSVHRLSHISFRTPYIDGHIPTQRLGWCAGCEHIALRAVCP